MNRTERAKAALINGKGWSECKSNAVNKADLHLYSFSSYKLFPWGLNQGTTICVMPQVAARHWVHQHR